MPGFLGVSAGDWVVPTPATTGDIMVATDAGLFLYSIANDTWREISPVIGDSYYSPAAVGNDFWVIHDPFGTALYHSADGGTSWSTVALPGAGDGLARYLALYADKLFFISDGDSSAADGIYSRAADGSGGWTTEYTPGGSPGFFLSDVGPTDRFWFGIGTGAGTSEFAYVVSGSRTNVAVVSVTGGGTPGVAAVAGDEHIGLGWFGYNIGNQTKLWRFVDNAATDVTPSGATAGSPGQSITGADSQDGTTIVALYEDGSDAHVYQSTDSGATWTETHSAACTVIQQFPTAIWSRETVGTVVVALGGLIGVSTDSGATWTESSAWPLGSYQGMMVLT